MRALILTVAGAVPLGVLTLVSFGGLFGSPDDPSKKLASIQTTKDDLTRDTRRAKNDLNSAKAMAEWRTADGKLPTIPTADTGTLKTVAEQLAGLRSLKVVLDQVPVADAPNAQKTLLEELRTREKERILQLDKDKNAHPELVNGKPGTLMTLFEEAIKRMEVAIDNDRTKDLENDRALLALTIAEEHFKGGGYDQCLKDLVSLREEKLKADTRQRLTLLRSRAAFMSDFNVGRDIEPMKIRAQKMEELLAKYPQPPTDEEKAQHIEAGFLKANSRAKWKLQEWRVQTSADPGAQSPINVSVLVKEVTRRHASADDLAFLETKLPKLRERVLKESANNVSALETELAEWRARNLKEKDVTFFRQREEAKKNAANGGEVLIGAFKLNDDNKTYQLRRGDLDARNFEDLAAAELEEKPHKGTHQQSAEKFNEQRARVLKKPDSLGDWKQLERECIELADKIKEFDAKTKSVYNGQLKFEQDVAFIKEVIKELEDYPGLFGPFAVEGR